METCIGKSNGRKAFDKKKQSYYVYWIDPETNKRKTTTYARWWWQINKGEIPEGYRASYKDGNPLNINPDNIILISPAEFGASVSERLMGHRFSEKTLQKMSDAKKGKPLSKTHKENIGKATKQMWKDGVFDSPEIRQVYSKSGKSNIGRKASEETKDKMSKARKGKPQPQMFTPEAMEKRRQSFIGYKQTEEANRKRSEALKGRNFSPEHRKKLSEAGRKRTDIRGENSIWWRGGRKTYFYPDEFSPELKRRIRKRDGYKCQCCQISTYGTRYGHVHHIDGDKSNSSESNLVLVCQSCHNSIHGGSDIVNEKILAFRSMLK